jgi:hypothetical protein
MVLHPGVFLELAPWVRVAFGFCTIVISKFLFMGGCLSRPCCVGLMVFGKGRRGDGQR